MLLAEHISSPLYDKECALRLFGERPSSLAPMSRRGSRGDTEAASESRESGDGASGEEEEVEREGGDLATQMPAKISGDDEEPCRSVAFPLSISIGEGVLLPVFSDARELVLVDRGANSSKPFVSIGSSRLVFSAFTSSIVAGSAHACSVVAVSFDEH
jgi:hypothetical protein